MVELRDAGMAGLGEFLDVAPHFEVRVDSVRGKLPCPFGDPGIFPKTNTTVRNKRLGREITYTDLHIHLIGSHGFYEGKGSPFRLEPGGAGRSPGGGEGPGVRGCPPRSAAGIARMASGGPHVLESRMVAARSIHSGR